MSWVVFDPPPVGSIFQDWLWPAMYMQSGGLTAASCRGKTFARPAVPSITQLVSRLWRSASKLTSFDSMAQTLHLQSN